MTMRSGAVKCDSTVVRAASTSRLIQIYTFRERLFKKICIFSYFDYRREKFDGDKFKSTLCGQKHSAWSDNELFIIVSRAVSFRVSCLIRVKYSRKIPNCPRWRCALFSAKQHIVSGKVCGCKCWKMYQITQHSIYISFIAGSCLSVTQLQRIVSTLIHAVLSFSSI